MTKHDEKRDDLGFRPPLTREEREAMDHRAMARGRGQFPDEGIPGGSQGSETEPPAAVRAMMRDPLSVWVPESQTAAARRGFAVRVPPVRLSSLRAIGCAYNSPLLGLGLPVYPAGAWRVGRR